jgi:hypothetical protein
MEHGSRGDSYLSCNNVDAGTVSEFAWAVVGGTVNGVGRVYCGQCRE